jgi:hypothetical protein
MTSCHVTTPHEEQRPRGTQQQEQVEQQFFFSVHLRALGTKPYRYIVQGNNRFRHLNILEPLDLFFTPLPQFLLQLTVECRLIRKRDPCPSSEILLRNRFWTQVGTPSAIIEDRDTHLAIELAGCRGSAGI